MPKVHLEKLPTVGDVTVVRRPAPAEFSDGFTWLVTFETQIGNIQQLYADGNSTLIPIAGANAQLSVSEVRRGQTPSLDVDVTGLENGATYVTRVSAKNAAGYGPSTTADGIDGGDRGSNNAGLGVVPFGVTIRTAPPAPLISSVEAVSASQLKVALQAPTGSPTGDTIRYKVRPLVILETVDLQAHMSRRGSYIRPGTFQTMVSPRLACFGNLQIVYHV